MPQKNAKTTEQVTELLLSLIRCGIGKQKSLPHTPTSEEWESLFHTACQQAIMGIAFAGVEAIPQEQQPPRRVLLNWYQATEAIKQKNIELNKKTIAVSQKFKQCGFRNCILKGQGISQLYPNPQLRTPGDIDIWLEGDDKEILHFAKARIPNPVFTYHHVEFPIAKGLDIEIHYRPSWMYNPFANKKLQQFFAQKAKEQFSHTVETPQGTFNAPTNTFNRVYILQHIYHHFFFEGIGIKQILDYYFVTLQKITPEEKTEFIQTIRQLGITRFAAALTYAMQHMFSLDDSHVIIPPNKSLGRFLVQEIMHAGNFGKHDPRYDFSKQEYTFKRMRNILSRNMALIHKFPNEMLWSPYFKIWHYFWKKRQ